MYLALSPTEKCTIRLSASLGRKALLAFHGENASETIKTDNKIAIIIESWTYGIALERVDESLLPKNLRELSQSDGRDRHNERRLEH